MTPINFSSLKRIGQSPAHYRYMLDAPFEATDSMRIGTYVHELVLGPMPGRGACVFYDGVRRGKEWDAFSVARPGVTVLNARELSLGAAMANTVATSPLVQGMLLGARLEVPLTWEMGGLPCKTGGVDLVGNGFIADLKTTQSSAPREFNRQVINMNYHAQMAFYLEGCRLNGIDTSLGVYLIAVESLPPYPVTVFNVPPRALEMGRALVDGWLATLKQCLEDDRWPGYAESVVQVEIPVWAM